MVDGFYRDLNNAKVAEGIVATYIFTYANRDYQIEDVSNVPYYYHKGDIKIRDKKTGKEYMLEVKDDSRIAETQNVLCEENVYYFENDCMEKGNMYSDYEYYCVVSQQDRKIYVIDFSILKSIYRRFEYREIQHAAQITFGYLVPIGALRRKGALIAELDY